MAAYSMDLRLRVLRDADAGFTVGRTRREVLRQSRVGRSAEAASARNRRGGASQANPLAPAILHAQLTELAALIREQPDRTLAELQEALRTPASLPTLCRTIKRLGFRFKKNGTRVGTRSR